MKIIVNSEIKCPKCHFIKLEIMPIDNCQIMYNCEKCNETLTPKEGDCCIFCSYGDTPCPPFQENKDCCK